MRPFVVARSSLGVSGERRGQVVVRDLRSSSCAVERSAPLVGTGDAALHALAVTDDAVWATTGSTTIHVLRHPTDPDFGLGTMRKLQTPAAVVGLHVVPTGSAPWLWRRAARGLRPAVVAVMETGSIHIFDAHTRSAIVTIAGKSFLHPSSAGGGETVSATALALRGGGVSVFMGTTAGAAYEVRLRAPASGGNAVSCNAVRLRRASATGCAITSVSAAAHGRVLIGGADGTLTLVQSGRGQQQSAVVVATWHAHDRACIEAVVVIRASPKSQEPGGLHAAISASGEVVVVDCDRAQFVSVTASRDRHPVRCAASDRDHRLLLLLRDGSARLLSLGSDDASDDDDHDAAEARGSPAIDPDDYDPDVDDDHVPSASSSPLTRLAAVDQSSSSTRQQLDNSRTIIDAETVSHCLSVFRSLGRTEERESVTRAEISDDEAGQRRFCALALAALASEDKAKRVGSGLGGGASNSVRLCATEEAAWRRDVELDYAAKVASMHTEWHALHSLARRHRDIEASESAARAELQAEAAAVFAALCADATRNACAVAQTASDENGVLADEFRKSREHCASLRGELDEATQRWRAEVARADGADDLASRLEQVVAQRDDALAAVRECQHELQARCADLESAGSFIERQRCALLATEHDHLFALEDAKRRACEAAWSAELLEIVGSSHRQMALLGVHTYEHVIAARCEADRLSDTIQNLRECVNRAVGNEADLKDECTVLRGQREALEADARVLRERVATCELNEQSQAARMERVKAQLASVTEELHAATRRAESSSRVAEEAMVLSEEQQVALRSLKARALDLQSAANGIAAELECQLASPGAGEPPGVSSARALLRDAMYDLADCRRHSDLSAAASQSMNAAFERLRQAQESCFPQAFETVCWPRAHALASVRRVREAVDNLGNAVH